MLIAYAAALGGAHPAPLAPFGGTQPHLAIQPPSGAHPPYFTVADPELLNTVLLVLSCGSEWGGTEYGVALPNVAGDANL